MGKHSGPSLDIALNIQPAQKTPDVKMSLRVSAMTDEEKTTVADYQKLAVSIVANGTEWLAERPTIKAMAESIRSTEFGKVRGTPGDAGKYVFVSYQPKMAAEPTSLPHLRIPPLRNSPQLPGGAHYKKMVQALVQSRAEAGSEECGASIHEGDCFVVGDGGRHGNAAAIMSAFSREDGTHLPRCSKALFCFYREEDHLLPSSALSAQALAPFLVSPRLARSTPNCFCS